ncbi:peptide/nickel transport system substrate-binding protein [Marininema mesophilum]|uniref:Peptide/nickel transport system substrate-binding protein n=2 Tax=Marininema mesophilum TaxID=1048340 RepID=A0A1H2YB84_9BACL|nr:ABC transporter substrate-binding protein [Marininema mesophilum]SDX02290.1 peptide/nickel transport system substrate-binding protein [Marininema mesophilum]
MKNLRKSMILGIALVFVLSIILAACGNKAEGKTLIWGRGADTKSLDPAQVTDGESLNVTRNIYDTLVDYKDENTEVGPALAESWKTSKDQKTWTFNLKKGVKFQDGTDFNAEAVAFNFERWMDKKNPYHKGGEFPYYGYMFGGYKGDKGHVIKSVKAVNKNTVQFKLNEPQGPFLANIAMPAFAIASPKAIKADPEGLGKKPVGTGPFKFESWKKNDTISLLKNKDYWKKGYPKLDKVIFKSMPDNSARFTALKSGEIDVMDGLNPDDAKTVEKNNELKLAEQQGMNVGYLSFNMSKNTPVKDKKVRQALNYAVDKKSIIKSVYSGLATPSINPMPDSIWGFNKQIKDYPYDLKKAKKLLKEAGYGKGFKLELYAPSDPRPYMPDGRKVAEVIQSDWKKIGVDVKIVSFDWQTYLDKTGKGQHEAALFGWSGDNGDPDNFLYVLLDKDNTRTPNAGNISFYKSEPLHKLLMKAQRSTDKNERTKLYEKAQKIIKDDAPWVPLVHSTPGIAYQTYVGNGNFTHPINYSKLAQVDIKK